MIRLVVIGLMGVVGVVGCGSGDDQMRDASIGGDGGGAGIGGSGGSGGVAACFETFAEGGKLGGPCRLVGGVGVCNDNLECLPEAKGTIGGPDSPIVDLPGGGDSFEQTVFKGSYCTTPIDPTSPTGCNPDTCAQECGTCTPTRFFNEDVCLKACLANGIDNSACLHGYECSAAFLTCTPGCLTDNDCLVFGEDTNDDGVFDPDDGDRFVYDTNSTAFCNTETYRCEHLGASGAEAGIACTDDEQCEANGFCLDEESPPFFPGGYCTKIGCDLEAIDCAGDAVCGDIGFVAPICLASCTVGTGVKPDDPPATYLGNTQGCREGYTCQWGRGDGDPAGFCDVGVFNDVTVNNIGSVCETNDECYSPFGYGLCDLDLGCTVIECGAPGLPADICGDEATCVDFINRGFDAFACLRKCDLAEDCRQGEACAADLDLNPTTPDQVCWPECETTPECRDGEVCDVNHKCV